MATDTREDRVCPQPRRVDDSDSAVYRAAHGLIRLERRKRRLRTFKRLGGVIIALAVVVSAVLVAWHYTRDYAFWDELLHMSSWPEVL